MPFLSFMPFTVGRSLLAVNVESLSLACHLQEWRREKTEGKGGLRIYHLDAFRVRFTENHAPSIHLGVLKRIDSMDDLFEETSLLTKENVLLTGRGKWHFEQKTSWQGGVMGATGAWHWEKLKEQHDQAVSHLQALQRSPLLPPDPYVGWFDGKFS